MPSPISLEWSLDAKAAKWNEIKYRLSNIDADDGPIHLGSAGRGPVEVLRPRAGGGPGVEYRRTHLGPGFADRKNPPAEVIVDLQKPTGGIKGVRDGNTPPGSPAAQAARRLRRSAARQRERADPSEAPELPVTFEPRKCHPGALLLPLLQPHPKHTHIASSISLAIPAILRVHWELARGLSVIHSRTMESRILSRFEGSNESERKAKSPLAPLPEEEEMMRNRQNPLGVLWHELNQVQDEFTKWFGARARPRLAGALRAGGRPGGLRRGRPAGPDRTKLEVTVTDGNQLTVQGERKAPEVPRAVWVRQERPFGKFARVVTLPSLVDADRSRRSTRTAC